MHPDEELKYQVALSLLPGVGPVLAKTLVSYCGSVENIFRKKKANLERIPGIGAEKAAAITGHGIFERAEKEVAFIRKHQIRTFFYTEAAYPSRLKNCEDAPALLFFKGKCELNAARMVAIVGTRNATPYGKAVTEALVADLAPYGVVILSGLAYGIDIFAHQACIKNNVATIGVIAHGLDRIYPPMHKSTAEKMVRHGGVLTEFPGETKPDRKNFPSRNRIVAGMADAVIVVESAIKGGALITADIANSYNREVFAVPGPVDAQFSQGCNDYIRTNKAALAGNAGHIAEMMGWNEKDPVPARQLQIFRELSPDEQVLVDLLREKGRTDIDTLMISSGLPVHKVSTTLLSLEFDGMLKALPGKTFELVTGR